MAVCGHRDARDRGHDAWIANPRRTCRASEISCRPLRACRRQVQATFTACLEKVDQLRDAASFRSFLFGVARFELLHHYRRKSARETDLDTAQHSVCDLDPSPSRIVAKRQEQRLLLEGLRRIPLDLQIVLELAYWEQLSSPEIAEVIGIPVGTVKSRVRRARQRLDTELAALAESSQLLQSTVANLERWAAGLRDLVGANSKTTLPDALLVRLPEEKTSGS
ncbi:MAG: sigma-70 family RNA polymerase sigma factor [Nannocystaceae bacterium]